MSLIDTRTPDPKRFIPGATGDWEVIIGMEVHAQVTLASQAVFRRLDGVRLARPTPMSRWSMRPCPACCP